MKKILNVIIACTVIAIAFASCNSAGSGESYTLKMRLKPGDKFKQDIIMNMNMNTAFMGISKDVKMKIDMGSDFEVLAGDSSSKTLKMTYTTLATKMDMGIGNSAVTDSLLNAQNKRMVGKPVTLKLDAGNNITDVSGFEEILSDSMNEVSKQAMQKMLSKENLNNSYGLYFRMYPAKPVKVGESWNGNASMDMAGINMGIKIKYTLVSVKDGLAEINVDGVIDGKGSMGQGGTNIGMDMTGTQKGILTIKLEDGYLAKGNYKMDAKAEMSVMGQKVPMTIKADVDILGK